MSFEKKDYKRDGERSYADRGERSSGPRSYGGRSGGFGGRSGGGRPGGRSGGFGGRPSFGGKPGFRKPSGEGNFERDGERPARRFERDGERPERRFERDGERRPERRFDRDGGRPERRFERDGERRPERRFDRDGGRPERRFDRDGERRPERRFDRDGGRPERRFERDGERRPERRFDRDGGRPERRFERDGERRPERRFDRDGGRPERRFERDGERRPERRFERDGGRRPERRFEREDSRRFERDSEVSFAEANAELILDPSDVTPETPPEVKYVRPVDQERRFAAETRIVPRTELKVFPALAPMPAVLVSTANTLEPTEEEPLYDNILAIAWTGIVNSDPPMVSISVRPSRLSHEYLKKTGKFAINVIDKNLLNALDYSGVKSGREIDKFKHLELHKFKAPGTPEIAGIAESPIVMGCEVKQVISLGSHDMFIAEIVGVSVRKDLMDDRGAMRLDRANLVAYANGNYYRLGVRAGFFGYAVAKPDVLHRRMQKGGHAQYPTTVEEQVLMLEADPAKTAESLSFSGKVRRREIQEIKATEAEQKVDNEPEHKSEDISVNTESFTCEEENNDN